VLFFLAMPRVGLSLPLFGHDHLFVVACVTLGWGLSYALLAGKARWYYGLLWGSLLWGVVVGLALLPQGQVVLPMNGLFTLMGAHLAFGLVTGLLNERIQPSPRGQGKVIFLRDYAARARQR
jgi:hypothetical protein